LGPEEIYAAKILPRTLVGPLDLKTDAFEHQPVYTDAFTHRLDTAAEMPLRKGLRENSFVIKATQGYVPNGWTPRTPFKLCSSYADPNLDYRIDGAAAKQAFGLATADVIDVDPVAVEVLRTIVRAETLQLSPSAKQVQRKINAMYHAEVEPLLCMSAAGNYFQTLR
jgi:hypothetical protein